MKKFILKSSFYLLPIALLLISHLLYFGFPPPRLSESISFNTKILNIKNNHFNKQVDVLAFGSSMSLNNIHTKTIKKIFNSSYLNISSWGQNIEEDYNLIKIFTKIYEPQTIIISTSIMDFNDLSKNINYELLDDYLFGTGLLVYKKLNFKYLLEASTSFYSKRSDRFSYSSLFYDDCGGVNFETVDFIIDSTRWSGRTLNEKDINLVQYHYLDSISKFCKGMNIELIVIQSPYRVGYYSKLIDSSLNILSSHSNKVDSILRKSNSIFIDSNVQNWDDSLFVDYSHLNKEGSKLYTEFFLKEKTGNK
ncbi:MAG: hypothetical protein RJQ00_01955 [Vicingaceae bacterium]